MNKLRWLLLLLIVASLLGSSACKRESRSAPPTFTADLVNLDPKLGLHTNDAVGERQYVVILADFPDVERQYPEETISNRLIQFLSNYYYEASYHLLSFSGTITKRYTLPHPVSYYKVSSINLEVDPKRVLALVQDAINAADADVAFNKDLYVVIALGATQESYGMIGYSAVPGMLGFQTSEPIQTASGEVVERAVVFCENAHLGTYIHDTLHMLGGVENGRRMTPCLYDHDLQAKYVQVDQAGKFVVNMGFWDPLSSHVPYNRELPPTGLSSWTKLRLGWIDPARIALVQPGETATVTLDPLVVDGSGTLVIKIPLGDNKYYLVENRQPIESDANLPTSGVLIVYADDTVLECRQGQAPVKIIDANPDVPYLNAAAYDIGKKDTFIDPAHNLAIVLLEKVDSSYVIQVTTPDQVK